MTALRDQHARARPPAIRGSRGWRHDRPADAQRAVLNLLTDDTDHNLYDVHPGTVQACRRTAARRHDSEGQCPPISVSRTWLPRVRETRCHPTGEAQ
jgi:hypothetical protein